MHNEEGKETNNQTVRNDKRATKGKFRKKKQSRREEREKATKLHQIETRKEKHEE